MALVEDDVDIELTIRPFESTTDLAFLTNCWLKSFRSSRARVSNLVYYPNQEALIRTLIQRPQGRAVCCVDVSNPTFIVGVAVGERLETEDPDEPIIIHWTFTKLAYRRQGVGRAMLRALGWTKGRTIHATHTNLFVIKHAAELRILENDYPLKGIYNGRHVTYNESQIYNARHAPVGPTFDGDLARQQSEGDS